MTQLNSLLSPINELMVRKIPKYNWEQIDKFYGKKKTKSLIHYADKLKKTLGKKNIEIWTFNSATSGGGVADLLDALLSLSKKHGINWHWFVIKGNSAFFNSTKIFHNVLHGNKKIKITNQILKNYLQGTRSNVRGLQRVLLKSAHTEKIKIPDIVLVHDPQPLALFPLFKKYYPQLFKKYFAKTIFIWQSHIPFNLSSRSQLGRFLIKYINFYRLAIYHRDNKLPKLKIPIFSKNVNSINPLSYFNINLENTRAGKEFIEATLIKHNIKKYGTETQFILQNSRFDHWKDQIGVIKAFEKAFEILEKKGKQIKLILIGPIAGDDIKESIELLKKLKKIADEFNSEHKGKFIYIKPLFTKREKLTQRYWKKFLAAGFNPDKLFPRLNRFQKKALKKMHIKPQCLTETNIHELEINALQSFSNIIILKSLEEGQGLSAIGAKFKSKPVIVSATGGLTAQIKDHFNGILVGLDPKTKKPITNPKKFRKLTIEQTTKAIIELINHPKLAKKLALSAHRDVVKNYITPRQLMDYYQIFILSATK